MDTLDSQTSLFSAEKLHPSQAMELTMIVMELLMKKLLMAKTMIMMDSLMKTMLRSALILTLIVGLDVVNVGIQCKQYYFVDCSLNCTIQCEPSKTIAGDGVDNDCDGAIDEEVKDGKDNDGDGQIDEDLDVVCIVIDN